MHVPVWRIRDGERKYRTHSPASRISDTVREMLEKGFALGSDENARRQELNGNMSNDILGRGGRWVLLVEVKLLVEVLTNTAISS